MFTSSCTTMSAGVQVASTAIDKRGVTMLRDRNAASTRTTAVRRVAKHPRRRVTIHTTVYTPVEELARNTRTAVHGRLPSRSDWHSENSPSQNFCEIVKSIFDRVYRIVLTINRFKHNMAVMDENSFEDIFQTKHFVLSICNRTVAFQTVVFRLPSILHRRRQMVWNSSWIQIVSVISCHVIRQSVQNIKAS